MKIKLQFAGLFVLLAIAASPSGRTNQTLPDDDSLSVTLRPQTGYNWCWAASSQMIMDFFGTYVEQCEQACKRFNRTDCCTTSTPPECDKGGWPEFEKYGFKKPQITTDTALSWDEIRTEISTHRRPFAFSWHEKDNPRFGHMFVAYGYVTVNGAKKLLINNPYPPNQGDQREMPYEEYDTGGSYYTHWDDYYCVTRADSEDVATEKTDKNSTQPKLAYEKIELNQVPAELNEAALRSLESLRALKIKLKGPGYPAASLTLADPFSEVFVAMKTLLDPQHGNPIKTLKAEADRIVYPIVLPTGVESAVGFTKVARQWQESSPNVEIVRRFVRIRREYANVKALSPSTIYAVTIPGLSLDFAAHGTGSNAILIPLVDRPSIGLKQGLPVRAAVVFPKLVTEAKKQNGLPN